MLSLQQFKSDNGIESIQLLRGGKKPNGCQFAETKAGRIFMSPKTVLTSPLFVMVNDGSVKAGLKGTLWIVNANVTLGSLL